MASLAVDAGVDARRHLEEKLRVLVMDVVFNTRGKLDRSALEGIIGFDIPTGKLSCKVEVLVKTQLKLNDQR